MSLFALVPLLTVLYTIASAIPAFQGAEEQMQDILFKHLMPESSSDIEQYLNGFSQQAKNLTGTRYCLPADHGHPHAAQY